MLDAIHEAQKIIGFEITTMELSDFAMGIDRAEQVRGLVTVEEVTQWLREMRTNPK